MYGEIPRVIVTYVSDVIHAREVDHEASVPAGVSGHSVTSTADTDRKIVLEGKLQTFLDVTFVVAQEEHDRLVRLVQHDVVSLGDLVLVLAFIVGNDDFAACHHGEHYNILRGRRSHVLLAGSFVGLWYVCRYVLCMVWSHTRY